MRPLALTLLATLALASPARAASTDDTLRLLNATRAAHRLPPLRLDDDLARAARAHSADMVARRYFDHVSPSGLTPVQRATQTVVLVQDKRAPLVAGSRYDARVFAPHLLASFVRYTIAMTAGTYAAAWSTTPGATHCGDTVAFAAGP